MSRPDNKIKMGYFAIENQHHDAIISLIAPATPATKLLDPFAGEGAFLEAAAQGWQVTPYANELDHGRAEQCIERFGPMQAVQGDAQRLRASNNAFGILWCNPPYDHDATAASGAKRVEFSMLRHSWKWVQPGGLVLWCVYRQHITEEAAAYLAKYSTQVDVWALPGKHLREYSQMVVVAIKGQTAGEALRYEQIMAGKRNPRLLTVQDDPLYRAPAPVTNKTFVFTADVVDEQMGASLIAQYGAWRNPSFQDLLRVPVPPAQIEPVVAPRPGHMALVLAAGVANGAVINTEEYGQVAIRSTTRHVEQIARVDVEVDPNDPDREIKKTTVRLKPATTLTLLSADGTVVEMEGDRPAASAPAKQPKRKRKKLNLLAVPEDEPETVSDVRPLASKRRQTQTDEHVPQQLAMF